MKIEPMSADEYEFQKLLNLHKVKFFTAHEVFKPFLTHPKGKTPPVDMWERIIPTLLVLDSLREDLEFPLYINSSYRCLEHNNATPGSSKTSYHKEFIALDVTARHPGRTKMAQDRLKRWDRTSDMVVFFKNKIITPKYCNMGLNYDTFFHIDTGVFWGLNKIAKRW